MKVFKIRKFWYVNLMRTSVMINDTLSHCFNQTVKIKIMPHAHELVYLVLSGRTENARVLIELTFVKYFSYAR